MSNNIDTLNKDIPDNRSIIPQAASTDIIPATEIRKGKEDYTNTNRVTLEISDGSKARYIVREQLASLTLPNDAIGKTEAVNGRITFDSYGNIIEGSTIEVDLRSLVSDKSKRDNYIRTKTLQTGSFPYATFTPTEIKDMPWPIPSQGKASFTIIGDLTIKNVTRKVTWEATSVFSAQRVQTYTKIKINFDDFGIVKPRLAFIVSVEDEIAIELDIKADLWFS